MATSHTSHASGKFAGVPLAPHTLSPFAIQMRNERAFWLYEQSVIRVRKRRIATTQKRNDLPILNLFHPVQRNDKKQYRIEAPEEKECLPPLHLWPANARSVRAATAQKWCSKSLPWKKHGMARSDSDDRQVCFVCETTSLPAAAGRHATATEELLHSDC